MRRTAGLIALAFALVAATAAAAQDQVPQPGLTYQVVGVPFGDELNVRVQPTTEADIVGVLASNARAVAVTGRRQQLGDSIWWEVLHPGGARGTGWVNARFLATNANLSDEADGYPLLCTGTEPFWSLEIGASGARFSSPAEPDASYAAGPWLPARGLRGQFAVRLEAPGAAIGHAAVVRNYGGYCSDNMSDFEYPFTVTLIRPDGEVFGGCCARAP